MDNNIRASIDSAIEEGKNKFGESIDFSSLKLWLKNDDDFSDDLNIKMARKKIRAETFWNIKIWYALNKEKGIWIKLWKHYSFWC